MDFGGLLHSFYMRGIDCTGQIVYSPDRSEYSTGKWSKYFNTISGVDPGHFG